MEEDIKNVIAYGRRYTMKLIQFYNQKIKQHFLSKLFFVYIGIFMVMTLLMTLIIVYHVTDIISEQEIQYDNKILQTIDSYLTNKNKSIKNLNQDINNPYSIINNNMFNENLFKDVFSAKESHLSTDYINKVSYIRHYLSTYKAANCTDAKNILVIDSSFQICFSSNDVHTPQEEKILLEKLRQKIEENDGNEINAQKTYIFPVTLDKNRRYFAIFDYLRTGKNSEYYGIICLLYDTNLIKSAYQDLAQYDLGAKLVLTTEGDIFFDSTGEWYDKEEQQWDVDLLKNKTYFEKDSIVTVKVNKSFDFITIGIINKEELYYSVQNLIDKIVFILIITIILVIIFTFFATQKVSFRVQKIINCIHQIESGNLSYQIDSFKETDELSLIARNLNEMGKTIEDFIKREYIATVEKKTFELKQKSAELYALQSQIDPHFLYNTLEVIRMKALAQGNTDVSRMIKILARIFRNHIKGGNICYVIEEIYQCKNYLELYNIRYQDKLQIRYDISEDILDYAMVKFLLQPVLENCIVHALDINRDDNLICIQGKLSGDDIVFEISDNGSGIDKDRLADLQSTLSQTKNNSADRIGIYNVNSRIRMIYGMDYGLTVHSEKDLGTTVTIKIKAWTKEELKKHV